MHNVRCETCGKILGVITDKKYKGKRIYEMVETVVLGVSGYVDGGLQASGGTYCTDHDPHSLATKTREES